jgi:hypothetical protein
MKLQLKHFIYYFMNYMNNCHVVFLLINLAISQVLFQCQQMCKSQAIMLLLTHILRSLSSSVNIVSGYGLDDRAIEVRFAEEAKGISL